MATITNKQKLVNQVFQSLGKGIRLGEPGQRPVLEQFVYAVCRENVTRAQADQAFRTLQDMFFDWNEIRVSSIHELADALAGLPEPEARAQRIIDFLQEVFETTFSFDLESLHKKGIKQAVKHLARYQAANDYTASWVMQQSLGGHAIPLDSPSMRALRRLGLLEDDGGDLEALRAGIEHQIPKSRGQLFVDLISALADEYCLEDDPACSSCPLAHHCPTGQDAKTPVAASHRHKPR